MALLKMPAKQPEYRAGRPHNDFLAGLAQWLPSKERFFDRLTVELDKRFELSEWTGEQLEQLGLLDRPHRQATSLVIPGQTSE